MKTDVQKVSACRVKCNVEATAEEIDPIYKRVHAAFTAQVKLPGFRPGKAPWARIEALYGKDVQEQVNQSVFKALYKGVHEASLKVAKVVDIEQLRSAKGQGASATFVLDLVPEFKMPDVSKWQVKKPNTEVSDADVDERLAGARRMMATYADASAEDTATANDLLAIAFTSDLDASTLSDAAKHYASDEEYWVQLQEDAFIPGLAGALLGKKLNESFAHAATFPADYRVKDLADKTVNYTITVKSMRKQQVLDDAALIQRMGCKDMDELRTKIRENIANYKQMSERDRAMREITEAIAKSVKFDLPERVVDEQVYDLLATDPAKPLEQFKGDAEALKKSDVYKNAVKRATDLVRRRYVLLQLADERKVSLSPEETNQALESLAQQTNLSTKELLRRLQDNGRLEDFLNNVLETKMTQTLVDECAVL